MRTRTHTLICCIAVPALIAVFIFGCLPQLKERPSCDTLKFRLEFWDGHTWVVSGGMAPYDNSSLAHHPDCIKCKLKVQ